MYAWIFTPYQHHVFSYLPNQTLEVRALFWLRERRQVNPWREVRSPRPWMPDYRGYPVGGAPYIFEAGGRGAQARRQPCPGLEGRWRQKHKWEVVLLLSSPEGGFSEGIPGISEKSHLRLASSPNIQASKSSRGSVYVTSYSWGIPPETQGHTDVKVDVSAVEKLASGVLSRPTVFSL